VDLKKPINIEQVNNTAVKYAKMLVPLNMLALNDVLIHCTPILGVQDSIKLGKVEHGTIAKKYTGVFTGDKTLGNIKPRTLTVYPLVAEMADEPERYRRSFITAVAGGLDPNKHPFELWLIQYGIGLASEDMFYAVLAARYDSDEANSIAAGFDGWLSILDDDITAGNISEANKNLYVGEEDITRANAGDYLLDMWRSRHKALRNLNTKMWLPYDVADNYDDWYRDEHDNPPFVDQAGRKFLEGTEGKVELVRSAAFPVGSKKVILTTKENMVYGTDKLEDMKKMVPFPSGNPYKFTAAMKFVFGTQFISIHERELAVNNLASSGSGSASV
jgi:hypothetical protein